MNSGDIIVVTVAALRVAIDRAVPLAFTVTSRGDVVCDPGLLAMQKSPIDSLTPHARRLLMAAKILIELAPDEVCSVLLSELRTAVTRAPTRQLLKLDGRGRPGRGRPGRDRAGRGKTAHAQPTSEDARMQQLTDILRVKPFAMEVEAATGVTTPVVVYDPNNDSRVAMIPRLPNEIAGVILQNMPALDRLRLRCTSKLWETKMLATVRELNREILDRALPEDLKNLTGVVEIEIADYSYSTMMKLRDLFANFEKNHIAHGLRTLVLGQDGPVETSFVLPYLHMFTDLEVLSVVELDDVDPTSKVMLHTIGSFLPKLTALHLPQIPYPSVKYPWKLRSLSFPATDLIPPDYLTNMTRLEELFVHFDPESTTGTDHIVALRNAPPQVESLVFLHDDSPPLLHDIQVSRAMPRLTTLAAYTLQSDESIEEIARLTNLTQLTVYTTDAQSTRLTTLTNLTTLDIVIKTAVRNESANFFKAMPRLELLNVALRDDATLFTTTHVRGGVVKVLAKNNAFFSMTDPNRTFDMLTELTLNHCTLEGDDSVESFPRHLRKLTIDECLLVAGSTPRTLPAELVILTLHEKVSTAPRTRAVAVDRILIRGAISGLTQLQYFSYTTSPFTPTTRPRRAIKYYERNEGDLAGIETVLLGPNHEQWA